MTFNIPVILLKNLVILPNQEIKLELNNILSGKSINIALNSFKGEVLVVSPMDALEEEPSVDDLPKVGVIAKFLRQIAELCPVFFVRDVDSVKRNAAAGRLQDAAKHTHERCLARPVCAQQPIHALVQRERNSVHRDFVFVLLCQAVYNQFHKQSSVLSSVLRYSSALRKPSSTNAATHQG